MVARSKATKKKAAKRVVTRVDVERISPKFEERRAELAEAALVTLSDLGYARTSLREIAQNTEYSHGVLHYYFADKVELITYCVKRFKARCVQRYDEAVAGARAPHELERLCAGAMVATLRNDAKLHRLWYDLRSQTLYESSFRADVAEIDESLRQMIWRVVEQYAELTGEAPRVGSQMTYAMFDGAFHQALHRHFAGDPRATADLEDQVVHLLRSISQPMVRDVAKVIRPARSAQRAR